MAFFFTAPTYTGPTIGAASTAVVAENADRVYLYLCNPTAVGLWVVCGATAAIGKGFWLPPSGGSLVFAVEREEDGWIRNAWNAIDSSGIGGKVISVVDVSRRG